MRYPKRRMTGIFAVFARSGLWRTRAFAALAAVLACLGATAPTVAQTAGRPTVAAQSRAVVLTPLTLLKTADLNFGRIVARPTAGTVTVDSTTGNCTATVVMALGPCSAAQFSGRGVLNTGVRIGLITNTNLTGPGQTMVLDTITLSGMTGLTFQGGGNGNGQGIGLIQGNGNQQRYRIIGVGGVFNFSIGGTLRVNANQTPGIYRGTVTVNVVYN